VQTAEEFVMMDCLSNGRFIGGIVRGVPFEYVSYNVHPLTSSERVRESFDIVRKCLNQELVDYDGKYWRLTVVSIWPKPVVCRLNQAPSCVIGAVALRPSSKSASQCHCRPCWPRSTRS
jgi:alkanesulfonate monooxygenase SsuD/methylene tetrahydromethanopterin reductase-like flavin-dependent oxidoreductase (luciferase family)